MATPNTLMPQAFRTGLADGSMDELWLKAFHSGERGALEECYCAHFPAVSRAVGRLLSGSDRETVIHELFFRLLTDPGLRQSFRGPALEPWLVVLARNQAIDFLRRQRREVPLSEASEPETAAQTQLEQSLDARRQIGRFREQVLPAKWRAVFEARFIQQLDQRTAAQSLGMARTTLAYQELRIRALLRRFLLNQETP